MRSGPYELNKDCSTPNSQLPKSSPRGLGVDPWALSRQSISGAARHDEANDVRAGPGCRPDARVPRAVLRKRSDPRANRSPGIVLLAHCRAGRAGPALRLPPAVLLDVRGARA